MSADAPTQPWRLFLLLSADRNLLGREIRGFRFSNLADAQAHADARVQTIKLQALNTATGERSNRVDGKWQELVAAPAPAERPNFYWLDKD